MKAQSSRTNRSSSATHTVLQKSSTLSRRYVRAPKTAASRASAAEKGTIKKESTVKKTIPVEKVSEKTEGAAAEAKSAKKITVSTVSTEEDVKECKTEACGKAAEVCEKNDEVKACEKTTEASPKSAKEPEYDRSAVKSRAAETMEKISAEEDGFYDTPEPMTSRRHGRRLLLAIACSAVTVTVLGVFLHFNMPNISVRVAAIQAGIEAKYPSYVPRNYFLSSVTSEKDGSVTMVFSGEGMDTFTLTEEKSTWDTSALLNNYVKPNFSGGYSTLREQGITFYMDGGDSAWVNGGMLYKISCMGRNLTKEQVTNLVGAL